MHRRLAAPLLLTLACGPDTSTDATAASTGAETTASTLPTGGPDELPQTLMCVERDKLDVLLVVEDSAAMSGTQDQVADLAANLVQIAESELDIDLRLAVTSASLGGKQCTNATVHDGEFLATSCRARLVDFEDPAAVAICESACPFDQVDILPTTTAADPNPAPRPWLETLTRVTNVDVPLRDAAACLAPRGDAGCTFPAPLAAMARALDRALDPADPAHGFLRADAVLVVVFVGPTSDCSVRPTAQGIFSPDSPFLSDPMLVTPGVCWNAGVRCTGDPDAFTDCVPEHYTVDGVPGVGPDDAVLEPVDTYVARLQALVDGGFTTAVGVGVLSGVPLDFPGSPISYSTTCDPADVSRAAICPGCTTPDLQASPPVRLRALAEAVVADTNLEPNLVSLCGNDPSQVFAPYVGELAEGIKPGCLEACVADSDPMTEQLDPDCTVQETRPDESPVDLLPCEPGLDGFAVPDGVDACFAILTGDLRSIECVDQGRNAEAIVVRDAPAPDGTCVSVTCVAAPAADCSAP